MELTFSQTAPVVCLPCEQTDAIVRFYHVFLCFPRRFHRISSSKSSHRLFFTSQVEFSFSFDQEAGAIFRLRAFVCTCPKHKKHFHSILNYTIVYQAFGSEPCIYNNKNVLEVNVKTKENSMSATPLRGRPVWKAALIFSILLFATVLSLKTGRAAS